MDLRDAVNSLKEDLGLEFLYIEQIADQINVVVREKEGTSEFSARRFSFTKQEITTSGKTMEGFIRSKLVPELPDAA